MASKILQRLRPSTHKDQRGPGPPEEPPEIAELVDEPDMAVRLSGTLSLSEDSLASEESDGTGTELLGGQMSSQHSIVQPFSTRVPPRFSVVQPRFSVVP